MKVWTWLILLFLLCFERNLMAQDSDNQPLWLLTAKVTNNSTFRRDTVKSFMAGDKLWKEEKHASGRSTSTGTVTVVIENQADDPLNDFWFDSSAGDPKPMIVTGSGSSFHSSSYIETIDGKLISGDKENGEVSGKAFPGATVMFNFTNDSKFVEVIIGIDGVANSKRQRFRDGEWVDYGSTYNYHITCSGGGEAPSANCKITKTGKGFQASWKKSETKQRSTVDGMEYTTSDATLEVTISPYKESDKPDIKLLGCTDLTVGGQSMVVATGKPVGGTFRFWAEPSSMMTVETDGSSANVTGASPEKGTFFAEYTTIDGKTAQTSQVASCVKVEKYNGGQPIPQIALYDIDGKKLQGIKTVPVDAQPANAAELVKFVPADPGVISALGVGSEVTLQGLRTGTTTLQAKTNCGEDTGPAVEVEVVNCDDETIATLERMKKAALENLVEATKNLQKEAGSPEFEKARDELVSSTIELLAKAGLTIITSGKAKVSMDPNINSKVVNVAIEIADKGAALSDLIASANTEEFKNNIGKTASGESFEQIVEKQFGEAVGELWGKSLSAAIGVVEVQQAARKFGDNIGEILKHEDVMKGLADNYEQAMRNFDRISKRLNVCKEGTEQPQSKEQPKPDPTPKPKDPTPPKEPTPKTEPTKGEQPQPTEPTPTEPTADDEVPGDPEPPVVPPKQVGLPYEPADCGCGKTKDLTVKSADFATLGVGMKNLGDCVEDFKTTSLNDYHLALQEMSALTDSLSTTLKTNAEEFLVKAKASKPRLDGLVSRVKSYDKTGTEFLNKMEKCPESVTTGMEIFQSVEKITVDSIKTNY